MPIDSGRILVNSCRIYHWILMQQSGWDRKSPLATCYRDLDLLEFVHSSDTTLLQTLPEDFDYPPDHEDSSRTFLLSYIRLAAPTKQ
jgi:hypothetical protein